MYYDHRPPTPASPAAAEIVAHSARMWVDINDRSHPDTAVAAVLTAMAAAVAFMCCSLPNTTRCRWYEYTHVFGLNRFPPEEPREAKGGGSAGSGAPPTFEQ